MSYPHCYAKIILNSSVSSSESIIFAAMTQVSGFILSPVDAVSDRFTEISELSTSGFNVLLRADQPLNVLYGLLRGDALPDGEALSHAVTAVSVYDLITCFFVMGSTS